MATPGKDSDILFLALEGASDAAARLAIERYGALPCRLVDLDGHLAEKLPEAWTLIANRNLLDLATFQQAYLEFLEAWPRRPLTGGQGFDDLVRHTTGHSLWWTAGPGASRQLAGRIFPKLRTLWMCQRAIERTRPKKVVIFTRDRTMAAMLVSQCRRAGCSCEMAPGSARPKMRRTSGRWLWLVGAWAGSLAYALWIVVRAAFARVTAGCPQEAPDAQTTPAVVMTGWFPRHVRSDDDQEPHVWFWQRLAGALGQRTHPVRSRFLLHTTKFRYSGRRKLLQPFHTGWTQLRRVKDVVPIHQAYPALATYLGALPHEWTALGRYARLERTAAFQASFDFAGADVSPLFVPLLRRSVAGIARWARNVEAVARSIRSVGNVRAVLVHEELYPKGMLTIAAARRLGIPSVGVQHATISPTHQLYTIPAGQVAGAPMPDYFAAYSEYAKDVVSRHGNYPAERVWTVGSARFDHLAGELPSRTDARRLLGLPQDKFVILLASEGFAYTKKSARALFEAVRDADDVLVAIKTHPKDTALDKYRAIARECGIDHLQLFTDQLYELIAACDVFVAGFSTTLLEAILAGRPTISVNLWGEPDRYPYVAEGGSLGARSAEEIHTAIEQIRTTEASAALDLARRRFLEYHLGPTATGRGAEALADMVVQHCFQTQDTPSLRRSA